MLLLQYFVYGKIVEMFDSLKYEKSPKRVVIIPPCLYKQVVMSTELKLRFHSAAKQHKENTEKRDTRTGIDNSLAKKQTFYLSLTY